MSSGTETHQDNEGTGTEMGRPFLGDNDKSRTRARERYWVLRALGYAGRESSRGTYRIETFIEMCAAKGVDAATQHPELAKRHKGGWPREGENPSERTLRYRALKALGAAPLEANRYSTSVGSFEYYKRKIEKGLVP